MYKAEEGKQSDYGSCKVVKRRSSVNYICLSIRHGFLRECLYVLCCSSKLLLLLKARADLVSPVLILWLALAV